MELATPFVVVAAAHPSLDDAVRRFCDTLRAEGRSFAHRDAASPRPTAALIRRLAPSTSGITLAAVLHGEVIGLAGIDHSTPDGPDLVVAVAAPWRRRGVATALGTALVSRAHAAGVPRIVVRTDHRVSELRELGTELGFRVFDVGRGRLDLVRSLEPAFRSA
ncbi:MAG: GNAT family N-acetyltransferase [Ilumatobacteraceae bacterium]